ncbi:ribose-phosphate pyrophosphokinase [Bacteroidia bacterium]|jgi:ribose-phosphate pyrophosphokinase|nr:ribose-phosphate pyrophosphokinase [Bacteroidia bacterium]
MPSFINKVKIFAGSGSQGIAERIAKSYGQNIGKVSLNSFSDGEFQPCIDETVRGCDVFIIQSTMPPADNLMELLMLIDAAKRASAHKVVAVIPYFGLARQDRKDKPRVPISSKMVANILTAAGADRVMTMDLHAPQIQGFFDIPVDHLDSTVIFIPYIKSIQTNDLLLAAPDVGATKRVREFAKYLGVEMVICDKARKRANEIASMTVIGDVKGKDVVLIDDICDTANTLCKAAALIKEKGAKSVRAVCTHPVLSGNAYVNLENSVLEEIMLCDTIPLKSGNYSKIKVLSVDNLFANAIRNVSEFGSISSLFNISDTYQQELI